MIGWRSLASIGSVLLAAGCGEPRLLGLSCGPDGCSALRAPYERCVLRELPRETVEANAHVLRCVLFTLDELTSPSGDERTFLSKAEVFDTPRRDDLDLRMAESVPGWGDGVVADCAKLLAEPIAWVPLATTVGETGVSNFEAAPLVAGRSHRVLLIDSFTNVQARRVEIGATIELSCPTVPPLIQSRPFELVHRLAPPLPGGARTPEPVRCTFERPVLLSRLYRRTLLTTSFVVRGRTAKSGEVPLWTSKDDWTHELASPTDFQAGDGLGWDCNLVNNDVTPIIDAAVLADACSLFGIFRLRDGDSGPSPEACVPR
ncbi:MAG TPA: hypothetical protein VK509_12495 [Polyangiales bacterium]|nr:hypothetical protein [Polyangiales bacterium]